MFTYPWGDMHSLNLGWFLLQFKEWVEKIQEYLDNGGGTSENLANVIAPVFNAANSYLTGDYVLYNDELYKANEAISPGTWDPDKWTRCLAMEEISSGAGVDNVARLMIAGNYSAYYGYQKYAICRYNDKLWMCNTNLPSGGEEWTPAHWDEITVGAGLTGLRRSVETLQNEIEDLNSDNVANESENVPGDNVTDAIDNLFGAIALKQNAITIITREPGNISCQASSNTTLVSLNLTPGTWIIICSHEWDGNITAPYVDNIVDVTHNKVRAVLRNNNQENGGGASLSGFVTLTEDATIEYSTYNAGSLANTAKTIRTIAFKLA